MSIRLLSVTLLLVSYASDPVIAQQVKTETKTGTVKEISTKGRSTTLVFTDSDGTDHQFMLTPRIVFEVHGKGDAGFVSNGQVVKGTGVLTNERLIVNAVSVYLLGPGKKAPPGKYAKSTAVAGSSQNSYDFMGEVIGMKPDEDYPDYQQLAVKIAAKVPPIMLEKEFTVDVVSPSVEMAKAGMPVEFEVVPVRGGKQNLVRATVTVEEGFKSEDVLKKPAGKG